MQKNWYMVYTKPKWEKKVSVTLTKRKIENFFPVNSKQITYLRKIKIQQEPLFESHVFVNLLESEILKIKGINGVVNFIYWKGKPAMVQPEEIEVIKEFTANHQNIKLEKTRVNVNDVTKVIEGARYSMEGNILTIKNTIAKVNLPSIGFTLIAKIETQNPLNRAISLEEKDLILQS